MLGDNLKIEKDLVKAVVESVEAHKFTDLNEDKECLINTIYPIIKNNPVPPVPPSKEVCRPFKCVDREDKDEPCIKEIKEKDKDSYFYELRKCYRWGRCFYDANSLFNSKTKELNATCGKKEDRKVGSVYPGEKCTNNDQCIEVDNSNLAINKNPFIKAIKQCTDGVCAGIGENKACSDTKSCLAGFFCDAVKKVCTKQIENKETTCSSTYECANNLACNGTCVEYNSVKIGEKVKTFSSNSNLVEQAKLLCEKGIAFEDGVCADSKYEDEVKVKDGVIECSADELCNYIYYSPDRNVKVSKKCLCGYNEEGKGYCPYATSVKQNFEKISNANKLFKDGSSCHTINRFDCNDFSRSPSYLTDRANGDVRFYNSPSCAINVLLSGNYVSVSLLGLILLSFLFLF